VTLAACSSNSATTTTTSSGATTTTGGSAGATTTPANPAAGLSAFETSPASAVSLSETGSSLLYPLFGAWAVGVKKQWPNLSVTTASTGSGAGISGAESGTVDIGASDAYLPAATVASTPGLEDIPLAISAQQVDYNVPGIPASTHLKLTGAVLADIYSGKITKWNDSAIAALNPGAPLPSTTIVPLHRSDSSGDTFLFSTYLNSSDPSGWVAAAGGESPSITFPAISSAVAETGNSGMLQGCKQTSGCVAYIGISYLTQAIAAGLGEAQLQNKSGNFELPTTATIHAEAASFTQVPASGAISLIYGPATDGYPIINFEYAIVLGGHASAAVAKAVQATLAWAMDPRYGSAASYLDVVHFQPLPASALSVAIALLKKI